MRSRPFAQVDVFTATPYRGNPLAVVLDGGGLSTEAMQQFTDWTNLSECTFVLPPSAEAAAAGADYRVRIFCPARELPFAGHPTLGTCHAWLQAGGQPKAADVVQECGVGLVRIRHDAASPTRWWFAAPPRLQAGPLPTDELQRLANGLGIAQTDIVAHAWCDNGPKWRGLLLRSAEQVLALQPDASLLKGMEVGVVGPYGADSGNGATQPGNDGVQFEVRAFFPGNQTLAEDPVTGSLNAALGQWLIADGWAPTRYTAAQGTAMGRAGRVFIEQDAQGQVWVGGESVTCIQGSVTL